MNVTEASLNLMICLLNRPNTDLLPCTNLSHLSDTSRKIICNVNTLELREIPCVDLTHVRFRKHRLNHHAHDVTHAIP